jgi:preprotein translocase subunit SecG
MINVLLVIHLLIAIAMIGVVLLQRSEGGGLGIGGGGGGGGGGMSGFLTGRGTANLLTRTTAILAAAFMLTSLTLTILAGNTREPKSILDELPATGAPSVPSGDAAPVEAPAEPDEPAVPIQ